MIKLSINHTDRPQFIDIYWKYKHGSAIVYIFENVYWCYIVDKDYSLTNICTIFYLW